MRLPIGIEILRCVILGRLLVEHVDKSHSLDLDPGGVERFDMYDPHVHAGTLGCPRLCRGLAGCESYLRSRSSTVSILLFKSPCLSPWPCQWCIALGLLLRVGFVVVLLVSSSSLWVLALYHIC